MEDSELLQEYVNRNSEEAFRELVHRHMNLVYSVAFRQVHDSHLAEDVAQAVFIALAKKAPSLTRFTALEGWLFRVTRFASLRALRTEHRRQHWIQESVRMENQTNESTTEEAWAQIVPLLNETIGELRATDRDALLLRFFNGKSFRAVGAGLGLSEDAAKKRVTRALVKLRTLLCRRGVSLPVVILAATLSAKAIQAAPMGLSASVATVAISKGASATTSTLTLTKGILKFMAWTKMKTGLVLGVGVLLAAGTTTLTVRRASAQREISVWSGITASDAQQLLDAPPGVSIRDTKFSRGAAGSVSSYGKILGIDQPFSELLNRAYGIDESRIVAVAPLPAGGFDFISSISQSQSMALQQLIETRFGVTARRETRPTDVLVLNLRRHDAPGLKSSLAGDGSSLRVAGHWSHTSASAADLAADLEHYLQIPVVDRTGLAGRFDVDLTWDDELLWDGSGHPYFRNPDGLKAAVLDQLGLELVAGHEPVEMLVVEKK